MPEQVLAWVRRLFLLNLVCLFVVLVTVLLILPPISFTPSLPDTSSYFFSASWLLSAASWYSCSVCCWTQGRRLSSPAAYSSDDCYLKLRIHLIPILCAYGLPPRRAAARHWAVLIIYLHKIISTVLTWCQQFFIISIYNIYLTAIWLSPGGSGFKHIYKYLTLCY